MEIPTMQISLKAVLFLCLILLTTGHGAKACLYEAININNVYQGQVQNFYYWLATVVITVPNLLLTLKLPLPKLWFLSGLVPACFHPFITVNAVDFIAWNYSHQVLNYLIAALVMLLANIIRFILKRGKFEKGCQLTYNFISF